MITWLLAIMSPWAAEPQSMTHLIAHRGGVVDEQHAENTLGSLDEAIRQGYWMVEIDVRRGKDGELVVQHDKNFRRIYGVNQNVADLTWAEIRQLRSKVGHQPPASLAEFAAACRGKMRLMVDTEETGSTHTSRSQVALGNEKTQGDFFEKMERILRENDLLETAFFIGSARQKAYFKGKARVAVDRASLRRAVEAKEPVSSLYFLFEHGNVLDKPTVAYAQSLNVPVVPSVNAYHYILPRSRSQVKLGNESGGGNATPESDIGNLRRWGVTCFQVDSVYAPLFEKPM